MSQAAEQVARQFANANLNRRVWGDIVVNVLAYGAKGDGVTDDTEALQKAISDGKFTIIELAGRTYKVTSQLALNSNMILRNGKIQAYGVQNIIYANNVENVAIENIEIDGNSSCEKGIYIRSGTNVVVEDCLVKNMTTISSVTCGIRLSNCSFSEIRRCTVHNITGLKDGIIGNDKGASRGILCDYSSHIVIDNCNIYNVTPDEDGDGIQFIGADYTEAQLRENNYNVIMNSKISNCSKRGLKLQQSGIYVVNNEIVSDKSEAYMTNAAVDIYASNITLENNTIDTYSQNPVIIGSVTTPVIQNVIIRGNVIYQNRNTYQGCILLSSSTPFVKNVSIDGNRLYVDPSAITENGVVIRTYFENVTITGNIMMNCMQGVYLRAPDTVPPAGVEMSEKIVISNNVCKSIKNFVLGETAAVARDMVITNNVLEMTDPYSYSRNTVRLSDVYYDYFPVIANNREKNGYTDGLSTSGITAGRPTRGMQPGFRYFDTTLGKPIFWSGSGWVDSTGASV